MGLRRPRSNSQLPRPHNNHREQPHHNENLQKGSQSLPLHPSNVGISDKHDRGHTLWPPTKLPSTEYQIRGLQQHGYLNFQAPLCLRMGPRYDERLHP